MKRSRLRPVSKKRAKLMKDIGPARRAYLAEHHVCACCMAGPSTEVHELANGPGRDKALSERCAWLAVCNDCNFHKLTDKTRYPVEVQYFFKALQDAGYYDRRRVNELRGRDPESITEADVLLAVGRNQR